MLQAPVCGSHHRVIPWHGDHGRAWPKSNSYACSSMRCASCVAVCIMQYRSFRQPHGLGPCDPEIVSINSGKIPSGSSGQTVPFKTEGLIRCQKKVTSDLADSISKCLKMAPEALTRVLGAYFGTV